MTKLKRLEELDGQSKELSTKIARAEETGSDDLYELKEQYHELRAEMARIVRTKNRRAGMTFAELDKKVGSLPPIPKYLTGVAPLDRELGGIESGTFIQFAGESYAGKSTLTIEILCNVAQHNKTVFFSFEMGERRSRKKIKDQIGTAGHHNLIIDFDTRNIDDLCNEILLYANEGVRFFAIDSKMKVEVPEVSEDYRKAAHVSSRLSKLTQQNDIIIILINQMSDDDTKSKRLGIKHGGDQKYDADIALFYVTHDDNENYRWLVCTKNRTGDERLFKLEVTRHDNRTVSIHDPAKPVLEVDYQTDDTFSMPVVGV